MHVKFPPLKLTPREKANLAIVMTVLLTAIGGSFKSGHFDKGMFLMALIVAVTSALPNPWKTVVAKVLAAVFPAQADAIMAAAAVIAPAPIVDASAPSAAPVDADPGSSAPAAPVATDQPGYPADKIE